ncbi:MAG: hypothetical protein JW819_09055 [Candidatus Krumholzibacteriota bacterium]|nr:hypothetical protein [Candidatus Krumholzibacteriota bacterium]
MRLVAWGRQGLERLVRYCERPSYGRRGDGGALLGQPLHQPALPKTRSGKIMRRILRKIAEGTPDQIGGTMAGSGAERRFVDLIPPERPTVRDSASGQGDAGDHRAYRYRSTGIG